ncbi:roquin-2 isoform 1-T2 [Pholidichthys leucotaenia]
MPVQAAQWTDFLSCPICYNEFDGSGHRPVSLGCSHTLCHACLHKLHRKACPFDQTPISTDIHLLPVNGALLQLVGAQVPDVQPVTLSSSEDLQHYDICRVCLEDLALYLKPISGAKGVSALSPSALSRPMQRKLVTLVNCQLVEEEGRFRAIRASRSLGERTVTELILQHQNPQQLSANLWAAVRARGCQFLGPAMQEDALKLVLLALEDGSALSRKVLVLFVVQKLEARFPQASKTSIGHVVQLLYRASCFKVTKRDEDSSLMQLKDEFRTYEALRREHDAQIVHIAMEAGLRISPEQWSSLLYGDLLHKSHMQSIIDKLQSPESFAKSVQELTIVLQRTGDPANLNSLRPHLELLANIDHNPDAAAPSWEELESVMLAVKMVVHGLVEFIQNFSKKNHDAPQPQTNSKYKTSMCRDLRQQGGCPRGTNCTFAHTQDELEKFRLRNKKSGGGGTTVSRPFPSAQTGVVVKSFPPEAELPVGVKVTPNGLSDGVQPQLISRGVDTNGDAGAANRPSAEQKPLSPPRTPVSHPASSSCPASMTMVVQGDSALVLRPLNAPQRSDLFYQDDPAHYQPASASFYAPSLHPPHKPCMARFLRSSNVPESSLPPPPPPLPPPYPSADPQVAHNPPATPSSSSSSSHRDGLGPTAFHPQPGQFGPLGPAPGIYAPLYDSRRVWRPQLYHREDARSNSLPPEVLHSSVYQPPLRERFNSLDSNFYSGAEHRAPLHRDYGRVPLGYDDLFRRKQEQWAHHHHHHHHHHHQSTSRPSQSSQSSHIFTIDFRPEPMDGSGGGQCLGCRFRSDEALGRYSPWSCGSVGPCLSPFEPKTLASASERSELDSRDGGGVGKHWLPSLDPYRRLKDEDPIIPFGEGPIISKWGAISRAARTGFHTTDPVQATACQGGASSTTPVNFKDYDPHLDHGDYRWSSRGSDSAFLRSEQLCASELDSRRTSISSVEKITSDLQARPTAFNQDHNQDQDLDPNRDLDLDLSVLDMEVTDQPEVRSQESLDPSASHSQDVSPQTDKIDAHLLKKMAFRKSLSPGGLVSGGLGMGTLVLRTGPPPLGDATRLTNPENSGTEMLLNGS